MYHDLKASSFSHASFWKCIPLFPSCWFRLPRRPWQAFSYHTLCAKTACTVVIWISALLVDMCWFCWYCRSVCVSNALWLAQLDFLNTSLTFALLWKAQMLKTHWYNWTNNRLLIPLWYSQVYSVPTYVWTQLTMGGLRKLCRFFFTFRLF